MVVKNVLHMSMALNYIPSIVNGKGMERKGRERKKERRKGRGREEAGLNQLASSFPSVISSGRPAHGV